VRLRLCSLLVEKVVALPLERAVLVAVFAADYTLWSSCLFAAFVDFHTHFGFDSPAVASVAAEVVGNSVDGKRMLAELGGLKILSLFQKIAELEEAARSCLGSFAAAVAEVEVVACQD